MSQVLYITKGNLYKDLVTSVTHQTLAGGTLEMEVEMEGLCQESKKEF